MYFQCNRKTKQNIAHRTALDCTVKACNKNTTSETITAAAAVAVAAECKLDQYQTNSNPNKSMTDNTNGKYNIHPWLKRKCIL